MKEWEGKSRLKSRWERVGKMKRKKHIFGRKIRPGCRDVFFS